MVTVPAVKKIDLIEATYLERQLPEAGEIKVKVGDRLRPFDAVGEAQLNVHVERVNLAKALDVKMKEVGRYLMKKSVEDFKRGEILAWKKTFLGLGDKKFLAPFSGVMEGIDFEKGEIMIRTYPEKKTVLAGAGGEVVKIVEGRAVLLKVSAVHVRGVWAMGESNDGEILVLASYGEPLESSKITPQVRGKLIVGGSFVSNEAVQKAAALGAVGIVCGGLNDGCSAQAEAGRKFGLMITEGFGTVPMLESTWRYLKSAEARTSIIIPERKLLLVPENFPPGQSREVNAFTELLVGDRVQVYSWPYFGRTAQVVGFEAEKVFPSGLKDEGVRLKFSEEKEEVSLPVRNVGKLV